MRAWDMVCCESAALCSLKICGGWSAARAAAQRTRALLLHLNEELQLRGRDGDHGKRDMQLVDGHEAGGQAWEAGAKLFADCRRYKGETRQRTISTRCAHCLLLACEGRGA